MCDFFWFENHTCVILSMMVNLPFVWASYLAHPKMHSPKAGFSHWPPRVSVWNALLGPWRRRIAFLPSSCRRGQRCCSDGVLRGGRDHLLACRGGRFLSLVPAGSSTRHLPSPPFPPHRRSSLGPVEWRSIWSWLLLLRLLVSNHCCFGGILLRVGLVLDQTQYSFFSSTLDSVGCGVLWRGTNRILPSSLGSSRLVDTIGAQQRRDCSLFSLTMQCP